MMNRINQYQRILSALLIMLFIVSGCAVLKKKQQPVCSRDKSYIEMLKIAGIDVRKIKRSDFHCEIVRTNGDTNVMRQVFADSIYFEGSVVNSRKAGNWEGYCFGKKTANVGYWGDSENTPMIIEIFGLDGILVQKMYLY